MFGIGFSELVLIGLILIIFIKPEDLPKFFRSMGKFYGQIKRAYEDVVSVKDKILKEIDEAVTLEEKAAGAAGAAKRPDAVAIPQSPQSPEPLAKSPDAAALPQSPEPVKHPDAAPLPQNPEPAKLEAPKDTAPEAEAPK
ncbi:MAG: hypothetical protein LBH73_00930 [Spirochaetaceae bacterium]|jgi:sec-independent protein translocase protein TatB|nr:hypothetical protein [Spirochaetaceae bacterium]